MIKTYEYNSDHIYFIHNDLNLNGTTIWIVFFYSNGFLLPKYKMLTLESLLCGADLYNLIQVQNFSKLKHFIFIFTTVSLYVEHRAVVQSTEHNNGCKYNVIYDCDL